MIRSSIVAAAMFVSTALSAPVFAQDLPRAEIRYDDLALATPHGAERLQARIKHAARRVCGVNGVADVSGRMAALKCADAAVANAAPQLELAVANARDAQQADNGRAAAAVH
jgi:UrcA family protein